ncbi:MAG: PDZ domain-containing protein [Planctomycetota bacterium]
MLQIGKPFAGALALAMALVVGSSSTVADTPPAYLGVVGEDRVDDAGTTGSVIRRISPESPAAAAGLKDGDVILAIGDKPVTNFKDLAAEVRSRKAGEKIELTVSRDGKEEKISVTLGEMPADVASGAMPKEFEELLRGFGPKGGPRGASPFGLRMQPSIRNYMPAKRPMIGIQLQPLTDALRERLSLKDVKGVVVADVVPDSPAAKAEIAATDVIIEANGKVIEEPKVLVEMVNQAKPGEEITLKLIHEGNTVEKKVKIEEMAAAFTPGRFPAPGMDQEDTQAEFVENLLVPAAKMEAMQNRINDLEAQVKKLTAEVEQLNSTPAKP